MKRNVWWMYKMIDDERIVRIIRKIHALWNMHPHMSFGELLESCVFGYDPDTNLLHDDDDKIENILDYYFKTRGTENRSRTIEDFGGYDITTYICDAFDDYLLNEEHGSVYLLKESNKFRNVILNIFKETDRI